MKRIALVGPNAAGYVSGGGSSHVVPFHYVSVAEGLRLVAGSKVKIDVIRGRVRSCWASWWLARSIPGP